MAAVDFITISSEAGLLFTGEARQSAFPPRARVRFMAGLRETRKSHQDCDVIFRAKDGPETWAHRFVLADTYPGCQLLFIASKALTARKMPDEQGWLPPVRVIITDLSSDMLELLVDFAYDAPLHEHIGFHNVRQVLELAEKHNITEILHHCTTVLERNLDPESCIGTYQLAVSKRYNSLAAAAFVYLLRNFNEVSQHSVQLESLTPDEMRAILADNRLHVFGEVEDTFRNITKWVSADVEERKKYLASFLPLVRFVECTVGDWERVITHPLVQGDEDSLKVLGVIHETLSRHSMTVDSCAGIDLSAKTWLTLRVPKDIVFLFGGGWYGHNKMQAYNARTGTWRPLGEQPTAPRTHHGVAVLGMCIYFVGGGDRLRGFDTVVCFDVSRNRWSQKASMAFARCYVCVAVLKGLIYAIGGRDGGMVTDTVERYDVKSNRWCQVTSMNGVRSGASAAVARGRIYVVGGTEYSEALDTVDCYDPSTDTWTWVLTLTTARLCAQVVACGEFIYVLGGMKDYQATASVELLDLRRARSVELPRMTVPRITFAAFLLQGYIYAIGERRSETSPGTAAERYDIKAETWCPLEDVCINASECIGATACVVHDVDNPELWT